MGRGGPPAPERGVAERRRGSEGVEWEGAMASLVDRIQIERPLHLFPGWKCEADMIGIHPEETSIDIFWRSKLQFVAGRLSLRVPP